MKCYYKKDEEEWIKGEITTSLGGIQVNLMDGSHNFMTFRNPEILFDSKCFYITGYLFISENNFKLVSVEVRTTLPKIVKHCTK